MEIKIKTTWNVDFAELELNNSTREVYELLSPRLQYSECEFSVAFVDREPDKNYAFQCPMRLELISFHRNVPKKLPDILNKIKGGYKPKDGKKAKTANDLSRLEGNSSWGDDYPDSFINFFYPIRDKHSDFSRYIVHLLSWRCSDLRHPRCQFRVTSCSLDDDTWFNLPYLGRVTAEFAERPPVINSVFETAENLSQFIQQNEINRVPLELLSEARRIVINAPRSALVIAVSGLEVKVKNAIEKRVPSAEWLIQNVQSPPTEKLICEYIPQLYSLSPDETAAFASYSKELKNIVRVRNRVTHVGEEVLQVKVRNWINTIEKIMYRLDYIQGNEWAKQLSI